MIFLVLCPTWTAQIIFLCLVATIRVRFCLVWTPQIIFLRLNWTEGRGSRADLRLQDLLYVNPEYSAKVAHL
jgi:hypothetical protein